jgi:hypothetical protein
LSQIRCVWGPFWGRSGHRGSFSTGCRILGSPPNNGCPKDHSKTLGPGFNPADYTFDGGTEGPDVFTGTAGTADVFCGFGGDDDIGYIVNLDEGDIFLGGAGNDSVGNTNNGTFYGGEGNDVVG